MKASEVLNLYFGRKKLVNPSYSLRALARDIGVSAPYISNILNGKKTLPQSRIEDFVRVLDLDSIGIVQLKHALDIDAGMLPSTDNKEAIKFIEKYKPLDKTKYEVLSDWYNLAILDLTTCKGFCHEPAWIADKLGISKLEVEIALQNLLRVGLLEKSEETLIKTTKKLRYPTKTPQGVIKKFHMQMIKKAYDELFEKSDQESFDRRLIAGSTFSLNQKKREELKEKIQELLYEVTTKASIPGEEGEDVYQFNVQFFPLST